MNTDLSKFLTYCKHYAWGLVASSFNGGITSVVAIVAEWVDGKLPQGVTWTGCWHVFAASCVVHAVLYFGSHPIPVMLPDGTTQSPFPKTLTQ